MMTGDNRPPQCQIHITQVRIMMNDDGDDDDRWNILKAVTELVIIQQMLANN